MICLFRYQLLAWTPLEPVWWPVGTTMMCASGISPGWISPCRPSDPSNPVSGESTSENTKRGTSTQLLNMWLISFIQTSSTLTADTCAKVYTHTQTHTHICWAPLSLMLTLWYPLFSFKMSPSEADGWDMCVCVCVCVFVCLRVFILCFTEAIIKDRILFWFWEPVGWAGPGLRLLREIHATLNLITVWSSSLFGLLTRWASYRKLCCWAPLFLSPDPKRQLVSSVKLKQRGDWAFAVV